MATIGYLMYGNDLLDEVTTNMIKTKGYSKAAKIVTLVLVAVIPITKFPLQYDRSGPHGGAKANMM